MSELQVVDCVEESKVIGVRVFDNPLRDEFVTAEVACGQTIVEITGRADLPAIIICDGEIIECEYWHEVVPRETLDIRRIPAGETGRLIGAIAILVLAAVAAPLVVGLMAQYGIAFGATFAQAVSITAGALGLVGNLILNALIPPPSLPSLGGVAPQLSAITGTSNQVVPFAPIPTLYGRLRYYPPIPMTGLPYTELVGDDQYFRGLFVLGYGPLQIGGVSTASGVITQDTVLSGTPIRLGDSAIGNFEDVEFQIGTPAQANLFTNSVVENAVNISMPRTGAEPTGGDQTIADGDTFIRTTEPLTDEVSLDIFFPSLFTISESGKTRFARVLFQVHYRVAGSESSWTVLDPNWTISSIERKPVRLGRRYRLPSAGTWEIRLTRVSTYMARRGTIVTDAVWSTFRSIKRNVRPFDVPNVVVMALRIRATDQLGGRLERLSVEATRIIPTWNGSAWVNAATRNPAWAYADVLTGVATRNALAKSRVDTAALLDWADWCAAEGLYCDLVIDAQGTVFDRARDVASTGLGSWHVSDDGSISIIRDKVQTSRLLISPRNSAEFASEYVYNDIPHGLRVQFTDPDIWEQTERLVFADGYTEETATKYETLPLLGVTDPDQAWKMARYHLAQLILRPETYMWAQDIQHLVYARGDSVDISNDVILVGLRWGRIKTIAVDGLTATVDEFLLMEAATTYALRIQRNDGTMVTRQITTVTPGTSSVTFATAVTGVTVGDHFVHGVMGSETIKAKITRIEPRGNFQARVVAVTAADNIFDAWTGTIPAFDPVITSPIDIDKLPPPIPTFVSLGFGSPPDTSGSDTVRLIAQFTMPPGLTGVIVEGRIRNPGNLSSTSDHNGAISEYAISDFGDVEVTGSPGSSAWGFAGAVPSDAGVMYVYGVESEIEYEVQIRSRRGNNVSNWTTSWNQIIGLDIPPPPANLTATGITEGIRIAWDLPENPGAIDYVQLFVGESAVFGSAVLAYEGRNTSIDIDVTPGAARWVWARSSLWSNVSPTIGPVSATAGDLDWQNIGGVGVEDAVLNSGIVTSSGETTFVFNYDGTNFQPQRTELIRYTYNAGGTYTYQNGSASADADRAFPWIDVPVEFYRGNALIKRMVFRHICNYGREDMSGRIGTRVRSVWISSTGTELDSAFTVQIGAQTGRVKWSGDIYDSTHDIYLDTEYGGSLSEYLITARHTATGAEATQLISISAITAVAPFYDFGGGGGGYK